MPLTLPERLHLPLFVVALLVTTCAIAPAGASTSPAPASPAPRTLTFEVSPGVTYTRTADPDGPWRIHVLSLQPAATPATMDVALARQRFPGFATVSSMASRGGAVAAVNGDFGLSPGRPAHGFAMDGALVQTPVIGGMGHSFAISDDETNMYVGMPQRTITAYRPSHTQAWSISKWNEGRPIQQKIVGFTPAGGDLEEPPRRACSVRLDPSGPQTWAPGQSGVQRDYTVNTVACTTARMQMKPNTVVLSARRTGPGSAKIRALVEGETLTLTWSYGWDDVLDSIGGVPVLLENGEILVTACETYLCNRHPRTGIGVRPDGTVLIVVVDGRMKASVGMNLKEFAKLFQSLGATDALNLDGGGSSEMWVNGEVMNRPSDGQERRVSSAVLILPGPDTGSQPLGPALTQDSGSPWRAAETDPGSTGGLLDYEAQEGALSPAFASALQRFRASQR